jgi:hypothetical protein
VTHYLLQLGRLTASYKERSHSYSVLERPRLPSPWSTCIMELCVWSFDSDVEDWSPFGLMDPTFDEDISTPEEATALREFVQAYTRPTPSPPTRRRVGSCR